MENIKQINFFTIDKNNEMEYYACYIDISKLNVISGDNSSLTICDKLIKAENEIIFSYIIRELFEGENFNEEKLDYQKLILQAMKFQKYNLNSDVVYQKFIDQLIAMLPVLDTNNEKINILKEIKGIFGYKDSRFTKNKIKRYFIKNLPYNSDVN